MGTLPRAGFDERLLVLTDTPVKSKSTLTAPAVLNGLEEGRQAVIRDSGSVIPLVPVAYFQSALLPPLRSGLDIADIVKRLVQDGHIKGGKDADEQRWNYFPKDPSDSTYVENTVFKDFELIATAVCSTSQTALRERAKAKSRAKRTPFIDVRPTTIVECNPDTTPFSTIRSNTSKPDSFARLNPGTPFALPGSLSNGSLLWDEIVVPGEFKKNSTWKDINDVSSDVSLTCSPC